MIFPKLQMTDAGRALLTKVVADSEELHFTKLGLGSGSTAGTSAMTNLVSSITITSLTKGTGAASMTGVLDNANLQTGYNATELGVYAQDPDDGEILYAYAFNGTNPTYIPAASSGSYERINLTVVVAIGDAEEVTAVIGEFTGYASLDDFNAHVADTSNPHIVTKTQVGLGNVPNVSTDNQTPTFTEASTLANIASGETLKVILGKIMKAISSLTTHLSSTANPHIVTKTQVGLGNVPNVSTNDQTPTYTASGTLDNLSSGETMGTAFGKLKTAVSTLKSHVNARNPHGTSIYDLSGHALEAIYSSKGWYPPTITPGGYVITGFTFVEPTDAGAPPASSSDKIVVIGINGGRDSSEDYTQIAFVFNGSGGKVYVRFRDSLEHTWTAWT